MLLVIFGHLVLDLFGILVLSLFVALFEALAGGSGITPVLSLLRQCREECRSSVAKPNAKHDLIKEFSIIHAMRSVDERPLSYELDYRGPDGRSRPVIDREREDRSDRSGIPKRS
jgi:ferredoxin-NADP reductase